MPPLPVVPDVIKLIIAGTYHDTAWLNIFHVGYSGGAPNSGNLNSYLVNIDPVIATAYEAEMSVDNEVTSYTAIDLASATGAQYTYNVSHFGVRTGDFVPANVAMVCSMEINRRYRGGHPRKYLPWGTAGTYATGSTKDWDSGFVADCQSKIDTMMAGIIGLSYGTTNFASNVNVSYRSGGAVRPAAVVDTITSHIIRTRICSQRRRLGRVGG